MLDSRTVASESLSILFQLVNREKADGMSCAPNGVAHTTFVLAFCRSSLSSYVVLALDAQDFQQFMRARGQVTVSFSPIDLAPGWVPT